MDDNQPATSWSAIAAGAVTIAALMLVLAAIGAALGFSSISPWPNSGLSAASFKIATGLYLVFSALVASTIGGYIGGRLRSRWTGVHTYEVQFRDTAHGFLAWAFATVVGAAVLGGAASYLSGAGANAIAKGASSPVADYYVARLMQPGQTQAASNPATAAGSAAAAASANGRARAILVHSALINGGDLTNSDRTYLAQLVAAQTGLNQSDAEKQVTDVMTAAKADAEAARKTAASISIWLSISMLVGAFAASLAAIEGGQLRDRKWRGLFWTRAYDEARIET